MKILLVLKLDGDFATGFDVNWEISPDGQRPVASGISKLALAPTLDLVHIYQIWHDTCHRLGGSRIQYIPNQITNVRYAALVSEYKQAAATLSKFVNDWLNRSALSKILNMDRN
ncbi:hypothetical protein WA1_46355 [Scytonema hofmannii PCC 7110]|uniref:Uncharacterized protein n=1 Tax=Scytonema hofmannii PCC 7110 TaxID=128403 RepID=A0A139WX87_9CYAN|nr:hypothetical protein [Scytonema hofmannii]KYC37064.1 hypothetical protein WA1_46355 [Scytonema hofmannii PCC 7110]